MTPPKVLIWLLGVFSLAGALAGEPATSLTQYKVDTWQTEQGLPLNTVQSLFQTRDGYLWVGTAGGLSRFDGVRFTTFDAAQAPEMASQPIFGFMEDAQGNLCPNAVQALSFAVNGAGSFRAISNGDATNLESFQKPQMRVFQGQLVTIVQASDKAGTVRVKASSTGLQSGSIELSTRRAQ